MADDLIKKSQKYNPPLIEKYSRTDDPKEEQAAIEAMSHFVTNSTRSTLEGFKFLSNFLAHLCISASVLSI